MKNTPCTERVYLCPDTVYQFNQNIWGWYILDDILPWNVQIENRSWVVLHYCIIIALPLVLRCEYHTAMTSLLRSRLQIRMRGYAAAYLFVRDSVWSHMRNINKTSVHGQKWIERAQEWSIKHASARMNRIGLFTGVLGSVSVWALGSGGTISTVGWCCASALTAAGVPWGLPEDAWEVSSVLLSAGAAVKDGFIVVAIDDAAETFCCSSVVCSFSFTTADSVSVLTLLIISAEAPSGSG